MHSFKKRGEEGGPKLNGGEESEREGRESGGGKGE